MERRPRLFVVGPCVCVSRVLFFFFLEKMSGMVKGGLEEEHDAYLIASIFTEDVSRWGVYRSRVDGYIGVDCVG